MYSYKKILLNEFVSLFVCESNCSKKMYLNLFFQCGIKVFVDAIILKSGLGLALSQG